MNNQQRLKIAKAKKILIATLNKKHITDVVDEPHNGQLIINKRIPLEYGELLKEYENDISLNHLMITYTMAEKYRDIMEQKKNGTYVNNWGSNII